MKGRKKNIAIHWLFIYLFIYLSQSLIFKLKKLKFRNIYSNSNGIEMLLLSITRAKLFLKMQTGAERKIYRFHFPLRKLNRYRHHYKIENKKLHYFHNHAENAGIHLSALVKWISYLKK